MKLIDAWRNIGATVKIAISAFIIGALVIVGVSSAGLTSKIKDDAFARREAEREQERRDLERERDLAIGRAVAAEVREKELAGRVAAQEAVISAAGSKAEAAAKSLQEENQRYENEANAIGNPVDPDERCRRICARLARLYPGAECACKNADK